MHTKNYSGSWKWASFGFVLFFGLLNLISSPGAKIWQHARYSALFKRDQILYSLQKNYFWSYPPNWGVGPSAITNIGYCYHIKMITFYSNCSFFEEFFFFFSCSAFLSPVFWTSYCCGYLVWFSFPPISFVTLTSNCFGKLCMLTKIFKILNFQLEPKEGNIKHGFKIEGEWLSLGTTSKLPSQNVPR